MPHLTFSQKDDSIFHTCGELSERFKEPVLKTGDSERNLGFESLTLRQKKACFVLMTKQAFLNDVCFGI